jgi:Fe-S-cluster-containing dehydrogenase component/formate-dependent nitrite reductase membrane component NrfD
VACKEEHNVPVGVFRTWVKYIEKGEFPATSRHFGVMRCNHCDAAPCVDICPTQALYYRNDRIVDFDNSRCIGCQSCMQACPYDALYIDPTTSTAAKCNFCAHRIELKLEPACVVVCPTRAISAGDLDDPQSNVGTMIATQKVAVRKPHKATQPKLFYAGIEGDFLQPAMMIPQESSLFAEHHPAASPGGLQAGVARRAPGSARVVYDVAHPPPWDALSAVYLWTKSIAGGILLVAAFLIWLLTKGDAHAGGVLFRVASPAAALAFIGITTAALIGHLKRPDRFYYILIKPNPRSWLVWGTWILIAYSAFAAGWLACGFEGLPLPTAIVAAAAILGAASAGYSGFLFAQAKGRDLWQSPLFLWILLVQAAATGSASLLIMSALTGAPVSEPGVAVTDVTSALERFLCVSAALHAMLILSQIALPQYTAEAREAVAAMTRRRRGRVFWSGVIFSGSFLPIVMILCTSSGGGPRIGIDVGAAVLVLAASFIFDEAWIAAGQIPALS